MFPLVEKILTEHELGPSQKGGLSVSVSDLDPVPHPFRVWYILVGLVYLHLFSKKNIVTYIDFTLLLELNSDGALMEFPSLF